jgi:hypothetical protein
MPVKRNTDPSFKGIQVIKDMQQQTLAMFQRAAACSAWMDIHAAHYDWWMFPIDEPSGYGLAWTVYEGDVADLKADPEYMRRYLLGVNLLAEAWGWDLVEARPLQAPHREQCWQHWPIRLYKAAKSVRLFGFPQEFTSLQKLGQELILAGESMYYHRDLSWLFREGVA